MQRTILVTELKHKASELKTKKIFGRYDPVTLNREGWIITDQYKQMYTMTDEMFAHWGEKKGEKIR